MKKKWFKRGLCAALSVALVLGLSACGGEKAGKGKGGSQDSNLAKQNVYSFNEISDFTALGDDIGILGTVRYNGKIHFLVNVYHYNSSNYNDDIKILSMNEDGTNIQTVNLEQNLGTEDGENGDNGGSDIGIMPLARTMDTSIQVLPAVSSEQITDTDQTEDAEQSEDTEQTEDGALTEDQMTADMFYPSLNVYESTNYSYFTFSTDAKVLYGVKTHRKEDYSDYQNPISQIERWLCAWDMKGALLWEKDMEEFYNIGEDFWINQKVSLEDGSLLMMLASDTTYRKLVVDRKGNVVTMEELKMDNDDNLNKLSEFVIKEDGSAYALYWDQDWRYLYIADYDFETGKMGEGQKMPEKLSTRGYNGLSRGYSTDIVISTNEGVFTYNIGDEDLTQIMSFVNSDLFTNGLYNIVMLDDEHFIGFYYELDDYTTRAAVFTKVNPEDIPDKKVLVMGAFYVNYELRKRVVDFNKTSNEYRIIYKEYESYSTEEDYMAGYTQLNNDIISGNMPDILVCNSSIPVENYVAKGLLADVGELIKKDKELSKVEFMGNVFDAYKVDGKLYYVIPSFTVNTVVGKTSVVGDKASWTMKEFREKIDSLPEGTEGLGRVTREGFMYEIMSYCGSDFIDVSTGKCNFDSQNFIDMLEYASTLKSDEEYYSNEYAEDYWMNYESQWREDRTLLMEMYMSNMRDINRSIKGYFGEDVTFIGFPTDSGKGSVINLNDFYAISSKSANQEGAWEFIRYYLTEEYQEQMSWRIPTNKNAYEKWLVTAMEKPYYEGENGEKIEYDETFYINGEEIVMPVMTQEEVDRIDVFIRSVDKPAYMNQDVQNIITEEAAAFFEGQKSAKDVVDIIQSRVKLYVNENM